MDHVLLDALAPRPTGAWIVTFRRAVPVEEQQVVLGRHLRNEVRPVSTDEFRSMASAGGEDRSTLLLGDLGIALVPGGAGGGEGSVPVQLQGVDPVLEVRPEFWMFALPRIQDQVQQTWGVTAVGAEASQYSGKGIGVCILDTGIDPDHPDLTGRVGGTRSFVDQPILDLQGHGTHCAGTAAGPRVPVQASVPRYGVAWGAEIQVGKVLNDAGAGREREVIAGMLWAIDEGHEVISMSLGRPVLPGESPGVEYERLGRRALEAGSLIVAAAGNESRRADGMVAPVGSPANAPSILAVGAVDPALEVADFSGVGLIPDGGEVDLAAPGVSILSSLPTPRTWGVLSGTSMACPHVAGVAALWAEAAPELRGRALWNALLDHARPLDAPSGDVGAGLVQAP